MSAEPEPEEPARREVAWVLPRVVLAACVLDLGMRFLAVDPLTFRGWEALQRFRPPGAPFVPGGRYFSARAYGDLAALGNLPEARQYRSERFSTDALGFRNPEGEGPASAIVVGDSFTVGSGVDDDQVLTRQLGRRLGRRFYNAGGIEPDPDRILVLARRLGMEAGLVIHEYHEGYEPPVVPSRMRRRYQNALAAVPPVMGAAVGRLRGWLTVSPLRIVCERALKHVRDDRILPNSYARAVVRASLVNGEPMLFRLSSISRARRPRGASAAYWRWMQGELRRGGLDLVVVLVPSKYTVYEPLLEEGKALSGAGGEGYLERLEAALGGAGVPVVNLTGVMRAESKRALERGEYLYWRDDVHWNARGIEIASAAIAERLPRSIPWLASSRGVE